LTPIQADGDKELRKLLPDDMLALLCIMEGLESVVALKRGNRGQFILFRGDKAGIETAAKRTLKVCLASSREADWLGDILELVHFLTSVQVACMS
jgi:hypothetical protein